MLSALKKAERRVFPKGALDAARQLGLFACCYIGYQFVRGFADGSQATAFWNATKVIDLENSLNIFVEPAIQTWTRGSDLLMGFADWMYLNSHYLVTFSVLFFIYSRRNSSFYFVRNMFLAAMVIALFGYALYPTAPPRLMPEWGFTDTLAIATGTRIDNEQTSALVNLYAAVPSMHVCFSLMVGSSMFALTRRRWARGLWLCYPLLVTWVVVVTGNHYIFDAVLGAVTAGLAWGFATCLGRMRDGWRFSPSETQAIPSEAIPAEAAA